MPSQDFILIVDDELIILESLRIQINRILPEQLFLEAASTGAEAFQVIDELKAEGKNLLLVMTDYHLDDMKGISILQHAHDQFPTVQKIILSGQANLDELNEFKQTVNIDAIVNKPWDFEDIARFIRTL